MPSVGTPDSILGTWKLQSWVREIIATGKRENFFGEKPDGYLSYSSDARMQAILIADNRIQPDSVAPPDEEWLISLRRQSGARYSHNGRFGTAATGGLC